MPADHAHLSARFRGFAQDPAHDTLYVPLAARLADEPLALEVLDAAPPMQRRPVLLFAAVHDLVLAGLGGDLAACYPSVGGSPDGRDVAGAFLAVLAERRGEVVERLEHRTTQTNEVGRCGALVVAHALVARRSQRPLGVVDLGASAGLNLWFDAYAYDHGTGGVLGDSPVLLRTELRPGSPPAPGALPAVAHRAGLDRSPVDVHDPADARWLEACVWPDEVDRLRTLRTAIELVRRRPHLVEVGDAVDDVGRLVASLPAGLAPVVTHSWMLTYVPTPRRPALVEALAAAAAGRGEPLWWVTMEAAGIVPGLAPRSGDGIPVSVLGLSRVEPDGTVTHDLCVPCHHHGRWLGSA